jgi:DUF1680 family protein
MHQKVKRLMLMATISLLSIGATIIKKNNMSEIYKFEIPESGSVIPKGWIKEQLNRDLTQGYVGRYNQVHSTVSKNVFVNQNLISKRRIGLRKEWWSGEHEGYWKDGVIRMAFLTNNKLYIKKAKHWIDDIISNTDEEGYIGIYDDCEKPGCRFNHKRGNGELWTTSRIVMALLAYYEFTNDEKVLNAAEKATKLIIKKYNNKNYFATESRGGGVSHGIGFFENLEWLYRITGNPEYLEFAVKLYGDFNKGNFRDDDLKTNHLLDESRLFQKHGAHIAEGLFVPRFIATIDDDTTYQKAAGNVMPKLEQHLTPGGAMRCDEWIKGRKGTADERYEYCGIAEMISPLNKMISFTGNMELADRIETMAFNAGQGARFPVLTALSYLTTDNRIKINHREIVKRESYDAAHLAAVCCALNGSRLMPYFVEGMWMKDKYKNALAAILLGPSEFNTKVNNIPVSIKEETTYPFSDSIYFTINTEEKVRFPLIIRKPFGCGVLSIDLPENAIFEEKSDRLIITHDWTKNTSVSLVFDFKIEQVWQPASKMVKREGVYLKRGALVYALPFKHDIDTVKEYRNSGFHRFKIKAVDSVAWSNTLSNDDEFEYVQYQSENLDYPWEKSPAVLKGTLHNKANKKENVTLVPMGTTIFRRVTFSLTNKF